MKTFTLLTLLLTLITFGGCSLKGTSDANLKITFGAMIDMNQFPGGVVIWGKTTDGVNEFGEVLPAGNNGEISAELPNGTWNFYVVGWGASGSKMGDLAVPATDTVSSCTAIGQYYYVQVTGMYSGWGSTLNAGEYLYCDGTAWSALPSLPAGDPLTGEVKCASSLGNELNGGQIDVNLAMTNVGCGNGVFAPTGFINGAGTDATPYKFPNFQYVANCKDISTLGTAMNFSPCANTMDQGFVKSVKIRFPSFRSNPDMASHFPIVGGALESVCMPTSSYTAGVFSLVTALNIPLGNMDAPLKTEVELYYDDACVESAARPKMVYDLDTGLLAAPIGQDIFPGIRVYSGFDGVELFVSTPHEHFCGEFPPNADGLIGIGDGSIATSPLGICTNDQLNKASVFAKTTPASHFVLLNDIDMLPLTKALGDYILPYDSFGCYGPGNNFVPIGAYYPDAGCVLTTVPFTGSFDGMGHAIKNLWFEDDNAVNVGLVAQFSGTSPNTIKNITFIDPSLSGAQNIGTVAGQGPSAGVYIQNIYVVRGDLSSWGSVTPVNMGGIVGNGNGVILDNVHVFDGHINAENDNIGGLAGLMTTGAAVMNSSFQGSVIGEERSGTSPANVGGLVGSFSSPTISTSFFEGIVASPNAVSVGALDGGGLATNDGATNYSRGMKVWNGSMSVIDTGSAGTFTWETDVHLKFSQFRECLESNNMMGVVSQIATLGRGTDANPVVLCNLSQFDEIDDNPTQLASTYIIKDIINIGNRTAKRFADFSGKIFGNNRMLYNLQLVRAAPESTAENLSLFQSFHGQLSGVQFVGTIVDDSGLNGGPIGSIVGDNYGTLDNLSVDMTSVTSSVDNLVVGGAVATNYNLIKGLHVSGTLNSTFSDNLTATIIGGAVGKNEGTMSRVSADMSIMVTDTTNLVNETVGGVVGENSGILTTSLFRRSAQAGDGVKQFNGVFGGLVGINRTGGQIFDSMTSSHAYFNLFPTDNAVLSPLVGVNESLAGITRGFYGGIFSWTGMPATMFTGTLAGDGTGSVNGFYVNKPQALLTSTTPVSFGTCVTNSVDVVLPGLSYTITANNDFLQIDADGLRDMLLPVTAITSATDTTFTVTVDCAIYSNITLTGTETVNAYSPFDTIADSKQLTSVEAATLATYTNVGWSMLEEVYGQPIPDTIIQAHLQDNVDLGPVWILQDHDGPARPSLFWSDFN